MRLVLLAAPLVAFVAAPRAGAPARFQPHVFVVASDFPAAATGSAAAIAIDPPWNASPAVKPVGADPIVRHFGGLHYVVNRDQGSVQVVDPRSLETLITFDTGAGTLPQDILVVAPDTAWVSRYEHTHLYKVDPRTGEGHDAVDLSVLADADGIPEMSMQARYGRLLFVQLQRLDRESELMEPVAPSLLAVVDLVTEELVDVDAETPGVQGIALDGLIPSFKMQVEPATRHLYVSTPAGLLGPNGGIEEIDLVTLRSNGFVTSEMQLVGDLTGFVMVSPEFGYVLIHTDFTLSSHLTRFSRSDGSHQGEMYVSFGQVDHLAFDPRTGQLFFPDPEVQGVRVFDAATGVQLTTQPIDTGLAPLDLVVARPRAAQPR